MFDPDIDTDTVTAPRSSVPLPGRGGIVVGMGLVSFLLLGPIIGIPAWIMARRDLQRIKQGEVSASDRNMTQVGLVLSIVGTFVSPVFLFIAGLILAVTVSLFRASEVQETKDAMMREVAQIASAAHQYRERPRGAAGGGGSYEGFTLSPQMKRTEHAVYQIIITGPDALRVVGSSLEDVDNGVIGHVNEHGIVRRWEFSGDFEPFRRFRGLPGAPGRRMDTHREST